MKLAFAIHQIILSATQIVEPGSVFPTENFDELERLGAVRAPSKEENALHQMLTQSVRAEPETRVTAAPVSDERADLEARAEVAGVEFSARIGDAKLLERVIEAEAKKAAGGDKDVKKPLV